jgi:hypothetical protein
MSWELTIAPGTVTIAFFSLPDSLASREEEERTKFRLLEWWFRLEKYEIRSAIRTIHQLFNQIFRSIYGDRLWSWRFLIASSASSYFAIAVVAIVFLALGRFGLDLRNLGF